MNPLGIKYLIMWIVILQSTILIYSYWIVRLLSIFRIKSTGWLVNLTLVCLLKSTSAHLKVCCELYATVQSLITNHKTCSQNQKDCKKLVIHCMAKFLFMKFNSPQTHKELLINLCQCLKFVSMCNINILVSISNMIFMFLDHLVSPFFLPFLVLAFFILKYRDTL